MERNFEFQFEKQPPLLTGGETSSAVDEAYINGIYAGLSFRSLLTYGSSHPVTYGAISDTPNLQLKSEPIFTTNDVVSSADVPPPYNFFSGASASSSHPNLLLNMPKSEQLFTTNGAVSPEIPPYNFFSEATASSSNHLQQKVPNLISLELPQNFTYGQKQKRQRQRLSDKTRILQKLLPHDKKMDMATVLEEAYNYIKFLQAQVSVLQSMPSTTSIHFNGGGGGDLGRLNRQELLQVVVNSPVAQTMLYSRGCCVYSMEQLLLLKRNLPYMI